MCGYVLFLSLSILVVTLLGCGEYEIEDRINPYDPENPWGVELLSVTALTEGGVNEYPSWSPDESKVAYFSRSDRQICIVHLAERSIEKLALVSDHIWETSPRWSPTESKIAYIHSPSWDMSVRDYPGSNTVQLTEDGGCKEGALIWSPDGKEIAYIQRGEVKVMNADGSNKRKPMLDKPIEPVSAISDWFPNGSELLVISGEEPRAYTVNVYSGYVNPLPTGERVSCWDAVWSNDGSKILYVTFNYGRYELWMMDEDGEQKVVILTKDLVEYAAFIDSVSWSRDESAILFVGSKTFYGSIRDVYLMQIEQR